MARGFRSDTFVSDGLNTRVLRLHRLRASPAFAQGAAPAAPAARGLAGLADLSRSLEQLVEQISPSVVQIFVTGYVPPDEEDQAATGEPSLERSSGSGVILDPDGYIITNAHVVEYATRLEVELPFAATGGAPGRSILRRRGRKWALRSWPSITKRIWR